MSSNIPSIAIFGEVVFDCFDNDKKLLGGAPFNVAWHLHHFGSTPYMVSRVGKDEMGKIVLDAINDRKMIAEGIQIDERLSTGYVSVMDAETDPKYDITDNVAFDEIEKPDLDKLEKPVLVYHGTLALRHEKTANSLSGLLEENNVQRFVDVNLRDPWWEKNQTLSLIRYADYVKLNEQELYALCGEELEKQYPSTYQQFNYDLAMAFKKEWDIVNLCITLGERGAVFLDAMGEMHKTEPIQESDKFVDTVGAGDAFTSVLILGITSDWDLPTTLSRAQEFAGFVVTQKGALCYEHSIYSDFLSLWGHGL